MTDREKIIEIIKKNGTYNGRSLSFDYYVIQPDDLADALIAAGIGGVKETQYRAEVAEWALRNCVEYYFFTGFCPVPNCDLNDKCWGESCRLKIAKYFEEQAEREIEEGK